MRIGLIPLDERPANTRYPRMLAEIGGASLVLPPPQLLSHGREPAHREGLAAWLLDSAGEFDALVVACEMLGYGGLVASRITDEPAGAVIARLDALRELKRRRPTLPIFGFNLVTRISRSNDATEEPAYWVQHGAALFRLSQIMDEAGAAAALRTALPTQIVRDFFVRRLRNHTVNLAALGLLADGVLDLLVLSSDDTSPHGLGTREKHWLEEMAARFDLGARLLMYPGADEVGCVLVARALNEGRGQHPRFVARYGVPGDEKAVAAFEDGPVQLTVERQIRAAGGIGTDGEGDVWLLVNPPLAGNGAWPRDYSIEEQRERLPHLHAAVEEARVRLAAGEAVAVADTAHANGTDGRFFELLMEKLPLTRLAAYAGWNTAGNSIGTAVAQSCMARQVATQADRRAQERFLLHRFVEDWAYQRIVREEIRDRLDQREPKPERLDVVREEIEERLQARLATLPGWAGRYRIVPGSVSLPWARTFEVDFELEQVGPAMHRERSTV